MSRHETTKSLPRFQMTFDPSTIDHLGLRLYSSLPPVLAELVSNSFDAESPKVEILLPSGQITPRSEVIVRDYGHGMSPKEVAAEYLPIGRNRRGNGSRKVWSKNKKRRVTGRKGLGKLAAFGVSQEVEVLSINAGYAVCLRFDYQKISDWWENHSNKDYEPEVVHERTGPTSDEDGFEVRLRRLRREKAISESVVRRGIARRLNFIGVSFEVNINGEPIAPGDRVNQSDCAEGMLWDVDELPGGGNINSDLEVSGWVGFHTKSSQEEQDRGVDIFATRKAVELGSFFNYRSTHGQFARAYLIGEIHADFLDDVDRAGRDRSGDLAATARNKVMWESRRGQALQEWGQEQLKWLFNKWLEIRRAEKEDKIIRIAGFDAWLEKRPDREQKTAQRLVKILVEDDDLEPASMEPLLEIVKSSVESVAFRDLLDDIEKEGIGIATLLGLFEEWRVIEAREHLRVADGRRGALRKLDRYIKEGALEVQQMQPLLAKHPWLIDSEFRETHIEESYSKQLKRHFPERQDVPESDKRIDILGIRHGNTATVVEIKRPEKTLNYRDLGQVEEYVDWLFSNICATGPDSPRYANGILVGGRLSAKSTFKEKMRRLQGADIRVQVYKDLVRRGEIYFKEIESQLMRVAPEYARAKGWRQE